MKCQPIVRPKIRSSEITPHQVYLKRREFLGAATLGAMALYGAGKASAAALSAIESKYTVDEKLTPLKDVTTYNNFYEFGLDKGDPAALSGDVQAAALDDQGRWRWSTSRGTFDIEALMKEFLIEKPHLPDALCRGLVDGYSVGRLPAWLHLLDKVEPQGKRQICGLRDGRRPEEMPGQEGFFQSLDWPYVEGLRLDEASPSADAARRRALWRDAAEPERRPDSPRRAVEIRLQGHQVDRAHHAHRPGAEEYLAGHQPAGIRLLRQRQPGG